jgi:hypothetical protein
MIVRLIASAMGFLIPFTVAFVGIWLDETEYQNVSNLMFKIWALMGFIFPALTGFNLFSLFFPCVLWAFVFYFACKWIQERRRR